MDYTDEDSLVGWLLTFGSGVEVLEPETVRGKLLQMAEKILALYRKEEK